MAVGRIPLEDVYEYVCAEGDAPAKATFYAFNTVVSLQVYDELCAETASLHEGEHATVAAHEGEHATVAAHEGEHATVAAHEGELGPEAASCACRRVFEECRRYERLFSRMLPESDIGRLNAAGGEAVAIDEDTYRLLKASVRYCELSEGTFDITVGAVTRLWDFQRGIAPDKAALAEALSHVDYRFVQVGGEAGERWARLADPRAAVDLGGTAKGYIADALCEEMSSFGLRHFLINLGGNVVVRGGRHDGSPFKIGIKDPRDTSAILGAVSLCDGSVVTSGLYERAFTMDGVRYSHILNPRTGMPVTTDVEGVTVVALRSADCDGFSTTLCALGMERGKEFARQRTELQTVAFVGADGKLTIA